MLDERRMMGEGDHWVDVQDWNDGSNAFEGTRTVYERAFFKHA